MVEAPGTAPGSEWFIATAIYRHSRQAGTPNIGANEPRRKSGSGGCANFSAPLVSSFGDGGRERRHIIATTSRPAPQPSSQPKLRIGGFRPLNKAIEIIFRSEREKRGAATALRRTLFRLRGHHRIAVWPLSTSGANRLLCPNPIPPHLRLPQPNLKPPRPFPLSWLRSSRLRIYFSLSRASRYRASAACWRGRAGCWLKINVG